MTATDWLKALLGLAAESPRHKVVPVVRAIPAGTLLTARDHLKMATDLKKERKFSEACAELIEAYSADGAENLLIEDRLRLPMYLLLAKRNNEGWAELVRLSDRYLDQFSQPRIAHQMRIFREKEGIGRAALEEVAPTAAPREPEVRGLGATIGELQTANLAAWGNEDITGGLRFSATMQLRTPLRVLLRHGENHTDSSSPPPAIAREAWEGIWMPFTKSFEEMGGRPGITDEDAQFLKRLDFTLARAFTVASDIGPVQADDYLPFLVAVREIVESRDPIKNRIKALREMNVPPAWTLFLGKHGGKSGLIEKFFPLFMNLAPGLNTPNRIASASDETILAIKGVGPAKLISIRERCARITTNRDSDRVDCVTT